MRKAGILFFRVTATRIFFSLFLVTLIGYNGISISYAQDSSRNKGFVTLQEYEKLKQEMESLKKQMQTLLKRMPASSSGAQQSESTSTAVVSQAKITEKIDVKHASTSVEQKSVKKTSSTTSAPERKQPDGSISLAEGDREKEATEAKRQLDVFLRGQKLLFKKGELQVELDLVYAKNNSGNQFFNTTLTTLPIQAGRSVGMNAIARYGLLDNVEFDLTVPFSYEEQDSVPNVLINRRSHHERTGLGNITVGLRHAAWREDGTLPDVILSLTSTIPTNDDRLFGSRFWGIGTFMTLVKTIDPVVLFGSLGYATTIGLSGSDQIPYSLGMGFSLNDRVSFSMSMSGAAGISRTKNATLKAGNNDNVIVDKPFTFSSPDINTMQFSSTIQVKKNLSVEPFVSFGLTKESPDFAIGIRLPYRLEGKHSIL